jgi:conjugal transfer pilus assembly protein TrbC
VPTRIDRFVCRAFALLRRALALSYNALAHSCNALAHSCYALAHSWIALVLLAPCVALAQAPQWPTAEDIERVQKATPFPSADRLGSQPVPLPPKVVPQRGSIDIEAIARSKVRVPASAVDPLGADPLVAEPSLRIFITLEMPQASLRLLVEQAARSGAVLVLRGLKARSMRETLAAVRDLMGNRNVAWVIDPEAFTRFGVHQAPSFVLSLDDATTDGAQRSCASGCVTHSAFVSVAGDVSLDYALETIMRRRPEATPRAEPFLKRLRGS